jgi:hypothetical protein
MSDPKAAGRHLDSADRHDEAVERHRAAAARAERIGDTEMAQLERRNLEIEEMAAALERDWAALHAR